MNRRDFLKFCTQVATVLGLGPGCAKDVATALSSAARPPVLWLHFSECAGCTESFLRASSPWIDEIILGLVSLDYHEMLMAGSGKTVTDTLKTAALRYAGEFFCICEGSVPTADNGVYGMIGGETMLAIANDICPKAKALIPYGNCASFGGIAAAAPNPTGAKGVREAVPDLNVPVVKIPGCPPNPVNLVAVLTSYLLKGSLPECDPYGRPLPAYGDTVHRICPYESRDDPELHRRCSEHDGCKGMLCKNNCPTAEFNEESYPMKVGHPCIGCAEPEFWDKMQPFYTEGEGGGRGGPRRGEPGRRRRGERGGRRHEYEYDPKWIITSGNVSERRG